jgi:hypothetical protein
MKKQEEQIKMVLVAYITKQGKRQYIKRFSKNNPRSLAYTDIPEEAAELEKKDIQDIVGLLRKTSNEPFLLKPMYLEKVTNRNLKKKNSDVSENEIVNKGTEDEQITEESK